MTSIRLYLLGIISFLCILSACSNGETLATNSPYPTPVLVTPTSVDTISTPKLLPTQPQSSGPELSFLYEENDTLFRYDLYTWEAEIVSLPNQGKIKQTALSPDGKFLAYSDDEGLKVFGLVTKTDRLLLPHHQDPSGDIHNDHPYLPYKWSFDKRWLVITIGYWDGYFYALLNVETQEFFEFSTCYIDLEWLPSSLSLVGSVTYQDMADCGQDDGIYQITITGDDIVENLIFTQDKSGMQGWKFVKPNIKMDLISFVFEYYDENGVINSSLMDIEPEHDKPMDLVSTSSEIISTAWSINDMDMIYYTSRFEGNGKIHAINVSSLQEHEFGTWPGTVTLTQFSPDGNWMIVEMKDGLHLMHISGTIQSLIPKDDFISFIGWENQ